MSKLWQDLDKLMIFVVVAEKGKINQASEALHLTQPSISRSIQKLEDSFGAPLFTRSREGVKLTPAGELLYETAARFFHSIEDVRVRSKNPADVLSGHLTIGTYESLAEYLWPDFLLGLQKTNPSLQISVRTNQSRDHLADLNGGRIDLLVDAEPQIKGPATSWPLYSDKFNFYISPKAALYSCSPEKARAANIIFVKGARDENGHAIEDHLEKHGFAFAREYTFDSFSTVKRLAIKGMGIAVLPTRLAEDDERKKQIQRLSLIGFKADGFGRHTIFATTSSENEKDPRIKKIISLLKENFR